MSVVAFETMQDRHKYMRAAVVFMESILPKHYVCSQFGCMVNCESNEGIQDESDWKKIEDAIVKNFGDRMEGILNQKDTTNHIDFSVDLNLI